MDKTVVDPDAGLASYAAQQQQSRGRAYPEASHAYRGEYQRDRDRIVHATAFRRLIYKTQVFVNHEGDLYRTRLTHSLEVAQIARTIARSLHLNEQLAEAISLAHDLGHTPFGHAGQNSLNKCMRPYGGFEHNLQSLRVLDVLEDRYADFPGLNLTFETREGVLKHCSKRNARELGELGERFFSGAQPGLEAQLANVADEIAYNNHDVDDGLRAGLITLEELCTVSLFATHFETVKTRYADVSERVLIHETVRSMINTVVTDLLLTTRDRLHEIQPATIDDVRLQPRPLVEFSAAMNAEHLGLKQFLQQSLYRHERVMEMTARANLVVIGLFELYFSDPASMPKEHEAKAERWADEQGETGRARAVADYVAGMTDRYALSAYQRLIDATINFQRE
jgi:dGTPase